MSSGKFTRNVHDLGTLAGSSLRRLLSPFVDGGGAVRGDGASASGVARISWPSPPVDVASLPSLLLSLVRSLLSLPGRYRRWWVALLKTDPVHVLVETSLLVICIALVVIQLRADRRFSKEREAGSPTEDEAEELVREWREKRKPLAGGDDEGEGGEGSEAPPVVERIEGNRLYFLREDAPPGGADTDGSVPGDGDDSDDESGVDRGPASALNFATLDPLSSTSSPLLRRVARRALRKYGCGSCGPRGFYGTIDAHLDAEAAVSEWLGTEGAVLYSDGASASTSTVAAFAKRGDLLVVDEGVGEVLLAGVTLSRANVRYFRHNDVKDLRRVLEKVRAQDVACKRKPADQRRFLVVEGLYRNWGTLAPLKEIVKLKEEFCYRLILDDSHAVGALGKTGRGSLEHHGLKPMVHAEILTFSLEHALGSVGGMTVGSEEVVDHQRLSGAGYCFSASAPPFLSEVCTASVRRLEGRWDEVVARLERAEEDECLEDDWLEAEDAQAAVASSSSYREPYPSSVDVDDDLLDGPALVSRLRANASRLYSTLTDPSHLHASKLHDKLVVTSHPLSHLLYLRLSDAEAVGRTRAEQVAALDEVARRCLREGIAIVSTGGHVGRNLKTAPEPSLRVAANARHEELDVKELARVLGGAVEAVLGEAEEDEGVGIEIL